MDGSLGQTVVALSSAGSLPTPVGQPAPSLRSPSKAHASTAQNSLREPDEPSVPYQARPVTSAVITHNLTPPLPVMEPGEMTQQVGLMTMISLVRVHLVQRVWASAWGIPGAGVPCRSAQGFLRPFLEGGGGGRLL